MSMPSATPQSDAPQQCTDVVTLAEKYSMHVYRPSNFRFDPRTLALPDDFFECDTEDVRAASSALTDRVRHLSEAPLMTGRMREAQANARMSKFSKVIIRVLLPDRYTIQGVFLPKSTIGEVTNFVKMCLNSNIRFHLFVVPPKTVLKDSRATLWDMQMVPAAQIYLGVDEGPQLAKDLLKESVFTLAEEPPVPRPTTPGENAQPSRPNSRAPARQQPAAAAPKEKGKLLRKKPKWFKGGK